MTLHTCDVSHQVTWTGTFSKWPSIRSKNLVFVYRLFAHLGFFSLRGMYWDKKGGQLHFKAHFELTRLP